MDDRLRILISAHIRWFNAEADYAYRLARGLVERGHEVMLWGLAGSPLLRRAEAAGIPTLDFGRPASLDPSQIRATGRTLSELIRRRGFHLLNAHRSEGYPVLARAAAEAGAAVVRTRGHMRPPRFPVLNRKVYQRWTDRVITANDYLREELIIRLNLDPAKVRAIPLGIRGEEVQPRQEAAASRTEMDLRPEDRVVGVMGRLGRVKGQETILAAAGQILAAVPTARFLMIFRDVEENDGFLAALRKSPHRRRFLLVGPRPCPADVMQLAEVAVIPSVGSEAHCRAALEWMALGIPVIGSRVGVLPEIIDHGATGFLVQPRYAETFARCISELLLHPARARAMGEAGRQRLGERFTEERMVSENLEVFFSALADKTASEKARPLQPVP